MFEIVLERTAEKDLRRLSDQVHDRVVEGITTLARNPRPSGAKKLSGSANNWRIRVGDYRCFTKSRTSSEWFEFTGCDTAAMPTDKGVS